MNKLIAKIKQLNCPIAVGLDSSLEFVPNFLKEQAISAFGNTATAAANAILEFNKKIINEIFDLVPAVKIQCAYYELFGGAGVSALQETIIYAKSKGLFTIVDGKRNDIGSTMQAYANAYLGSTEILNGEHVKPFDCDALTINPYLGSDGILPVVEVCKKFDKCAFVLVKTSNPGSGELQNLTLTTNELVYEKVAELCEQVFKPELSSCGYSKIGAVVGATHPNELKKLRSLLPNTFFLVPGFGAQGATAADVKFAFDNNKTGAIINSSRAILGAAKKECCPEADFAKAARRAVQAMKNSINEELAKA